MTDESGPWALALGVLGIGVAAFANEIRRQRADDEDGDE